MAGGALAIRHRGQGSLPAQDISGADNLERMDALSFSPWRVTAEHAPLGEIQGIEKEVYRRSSIARHRLNRQERREPRSVREALASDKPSKATSQPTGAPWHNLPRRWPPVRPLIQPACRRTVLGHLRDSFRPPPACVLPAFFHRTAVSAYGMS